MTKVSVRRSEAAAMLGLGLNSLDLLISSGEIGVVRVGRAVVVPVAELESFLCRRRQTKASAVATVEA